MEDIDEQRPCFKVDITPLLSQTVTANYSEHQVLVHISYFPMLNTKKYSILEKLENMYDELDQVFAINFLIAADENQRRTSMLVENKVYDEDLENAHMTFSFDLSYFAWNESDPENIHPGINTDPDFTSDKDFDMMHFVHLLNKRL